MDREIVLGMRADRPRASGLLQWLRRGDDRPVCAPVPLALARGRYSAVCVASSSSLTTRLPLWTAVQWNSSAQDARAARRRASDGVLLRRVNTCRQILSGSRHACRAVENGPALTSS